MAAESNSSFHHSETLIPAAALNRHSISFQSHAVNCTSEMIPMGSYFGVNSTTAMILPGNANIISNAPGVTQASNSSGSHFLDSVPTPNHESVLLAEWSAEDQYKLEEGLVKYANEPSIMKYIKIAATLHDKSVRDVALRCRWMTRKRRKPEEHTAGKRAKDRKDKLVESSSKTNIASSPPLNMATYSLLMHHMDQNDHVSCEVGGTAKHLLEQNAQVFDQITANISVYKLQDNIDLFCQTRNNITAILNNMKDMPGIMSQMPPLPVCINEDLANSILPNTTHTMVFGSPSGIHLKQEPRC
ncbi:uncharacterized protein LOC131154075 isoform X2 [Malania oleifera]|uniref:uncharacterized protein LOC131154075 isoform X2 n=1 Tax=Malania oleifera TaxID=397392 RepID=UPI0025AE5804|nr:uncharacterized protein LOC131154075 isoform X2 [Malania oleifera]